MFDGLTAKRATGFWAAVAGPLIKQQRPPSFIAGR